MSTPVTHMQVAAVITYKPGQAVGRCEFPKCTFTCRAINERLRLAVKDCQLSLQRHMNIEHKAHVGDYYFDLIEEGKQYVK